ncbi:1-phosphofructokinase [Lachnospiraceae bacterium C1.1]|nr:1-phosphofructokinase [Lachnospiraceae bacterium C1.1]
MIYTVTFNPAIDYIMRLNGELAEGMTNRTLSEECFFGGKGINVSTILKNLGIDNTAFGFIAGFTGKAIAEDVKRKGIKADFIELPNGISRINVKMKAEKETEVNAQGPDIPKDCLEELFKKIERLKDGDIIILAGSIPSTLPEDVYEQILERLEGKKIEKVVDATKDLLKNILKFHPFLIKPNKDELGELFGVTIKNDEEIELYAGKLQAMGARNVLVSMAAEGAMLITENGDKFRVGVPFGKVRNSVGAGDSMLAGFIAGYLENGDYEKALKLGTAAGSATAFSDDLASGEKIIELYKNYKFSQ